MRSLRALAWRNLQEHRLRTVLSALSVTMGTATLVAADVTGTAIRNAGEALATGGKTVPFVGNFMNQALSIMGLIILLAAAFLVFNTLTMTVTQRRQQLGSLRMLGMTRRQIMGLILTEALLTGGLGTLLGLVAGPFLGRGLLAVLARFVQVVHGSATVTVGSMVRAMAMGLGISLLAALLPAWRANRTTPLVAVRGVEPEIKAGRPGRQAALGLLAGGGLLGYLLWRPPATRPLPPPWDFALTGLLALAWLGSLTLILPFLLAGVGRGLGRLLRRRSGAGQLAADNLNRAPGRSILTILTLAIGLLTIVGVNGITTFTFTVAATGLANRYDVGWIAMHFPMRTGGTLVDWELVSQWDLTAMNVGPDFLSDVEEAAAARANLFPVSEQPVPELALMAGMPSAIADPALLRRLDLFTFEEGSWDQAQPIMEKGCGLLLTRRIALQHGAKLYDTITLAGVNGPIECTVAGLGTGMFMGTSIISANAGPALGLKPGSVFGLIIQPLPGVDRAALRADLDRLLQRYPDYSLFEVAPFFQDTFKMVDSLQVLLNGMLLLAVLAAALGVVNTTMISVAERQRELSLLRAVGATRGQVCMIVAGEAGLLGVVGGLLGLVAGLGLTWIFVTTNGANMWGWSDLALRPALWTSIVPAFWSGLVGLVVGPAVCAAAAWLPARAAVRGTAANPPC